MAVRARERGDEGEEVRRERERRARRVTRRDVSTEPRERHAFARKRVSRRKNPAEKILGPRVKKIECPFTHEFSSFGHHPTCHEKPVFDTFDIGRDGIPVLGQATQNLPRVLLEVDGDDVYANGVYRLIYGNQSNLA